MAPLRTLASALAAASFLTGCSAASDTFWPSLGGGGEEQPAPQQARARQPATDGHAVSIPPSRAEANPQPTLSATAPPPKLLGSTNFIPPSLSEQKPTGTFVGQKVTVVRNELRRLLTEIESENRELQAIRAKTVQHTRRYHELIGGINTRLQIGTTPGNPELIRDWNGAQAELAQIDTDIAQMNALANRVAGTSTLSAYLLETVRATYGLTGAVEADHDQLAVLEDETNRTVVLIDRLLNELSEDIRRQSAYIGNERGNMATLSVAIKNGELLGTSLARRSYPGTVPPPANPAVATRPLTPPPPANGSSGTDGGARRPLVVIRFDRPNVPYEQPLYTAVSRALDRKPSATFDLVAISSNRGTQGEVVLAQNASRRNAEAVLRSLSDMGLPLDRVRLSATSSGRVSSSEVHLYVR